MNVVWLMTLVSLVGLNAYNIYDNVMDKVMHINTLFIIIVLCLSATTLMAPRRAGQTIASKMSTTPVVLLVLLQGFMTYESNHASDHPKL